MIFSKLTLLLSSLALGSSSASAHEVFPSQVTLLLEYYEVDHAALTPLLNNYQSQPDAKGLLAELQDMEKNGKSRLVNSTYVVTLSGQRTNTGSIREYIYPTVFDPPGPIRDVKLDNTKDEAAEIVDPFREGAEEIAPEAPRQVSVITELIEVNAGMASRIARQLSGCADATQIRRRLEGAIKSGDARLLEISSEITRSGQKTKGESSREFIYPTEYDPAEIPQTLTGPIDPGLDLTTSMGATAFEMRPLGFSVELDPVISEDGKVIEIVFSSEAVKHRAASFTEKEQTAPNNRFLKP